MAKDVKAGKVKTVQGSDLTLSTSNGVKVDGANVTQSSSTGAGVANPAEENRKCWSL